MPLSRNVHVCKLFVCIVQWVKLNVKKSILKSCKRDSHLSHLSEERERKKTRFTDIKMITRREAR